MSMYRYLWYAGLRKAWLEHNKIDFYNDLHVRIPVKRMPNEKFGI
jgi:hypothetical protein